MGKMFLLILTLFLLHPSFHAKKRQRHLNKSQITRSQIDDGRIKQHNFEEMTLFMEYFAQQYPRIAFLYYIGTSYKNRKLWVMEISNNPGKHQPGEPEMKYIGNINANGVVGREILLQLIKHLCESYGKNDEVTELINKTSIHILPSMNPSRAPVNFNKDFWDHNPMPETEAIMKWLKEYPWFVLSAGFFTGEFVVSYPWDHSPTDENKYSATEDDDVFRVLAKTYSKNHPQMHLSNPNTDCTANPGRFKDGITNGAAWSSFDHSMQDYNYVNFNCFEVSVWLGCNDSPSENELARYWEDNRKPLLKYIAMANKGVKGFVKDQNGNPIKRAKIYISKGFYMHTTEDGEYWRLLLPGKYQVKVYASGFIPKAVDVDVGEGDAVQLNVTLIQRY